MNLLPFAHAKWIVAPFCGGPQEMSPASYLRGCFWLPEGIRSARLAVTALGIYQCEINGCTLGCSVFAPGWTDYRKRVRYQTHDVTSYLLAGKNALGVVLGDGWYCGYVAWRSRQNYGERPALLAELTVTLIDGSTQVFASNEGWKASSGPILENDLLMGERYDANLEMPGWSQANFNDTSWESAGILPDPGVELNPSMDPEVRRQEMLVPISERRAGGHRIFDFGQNFSGRVRIKVRARQGTMLTIRHAEVLDQDGAPYYENLRRARATDFYTCRGGEKEVWEPCFTFHGFRYAEVSGLGDDDKLEVAGIVLHSDMPGIGQFSCSNPLLNQLQSNIIWGQKSNFLEVPTDCPQRDERLGWTGDAQVFIRTACFNMDVRAFFHKWMQDVRDAQGPEGAVSAFVPDPRPLVPGPGRDGGPAWSDATIICPWTIYCCYGDRKILEDHYDSMRQFITFLLTECSREFIRCHPDLDNLTCYGDWLALEGSGDSSDSTPRDLIGTAFLAHDLELMRRIAAILGKDGETIRFSEWHKETVAAFRRRFVNPEGLLTATTQTAYVLALHFNLLPTALRPGAVEELVRNIQKRNTHIGTGFVGTPYLLEVLESSGHLELAYQLLEQETFPSWLFPVKNGATTIWERWDGWSPENGFQDPKMNSFNHYAYGAVGEWMVRSVAGLELDPEQPGYRRVIFRPRPGGTLTWAEAALDSPQGRVGIRWELQADGLFMDVTIPIGVEAILNVPPGFGEYPAPFGCGRTRFLLPFQK